MDLRALLTAGAAGASRSRSRPSEGSLERSQPAQLQRDRGCAAALLQEVHGPQPAAVVATAVVPSAAQALRLLGAPARKTLRHQGSPRAHVQHTSASVRVCVCVRARRALHSPANVTTACGVELLERDGARASHVVRPTSRAGARCSMHDSRAACAQVRRALLNMLC